MNIEVLKYEALSLHAQEPLSSMFVLSPYVWIENDRCEMMVRAVNRSNDAREKIARIYHGKSIDGLTFVMDDRPIIAPGPDEEDIGGCEDPSVVVESGLHVFYSGYDPIRRRTRLLRASGDSMQTLKKHGPLFLDAGYANAKEASLWKSPEGTWRLYFEYAADDKSKIGIATSASLSGPWKTAIFSLDARSGRWDDWHLSPGPIIPLESNKSLMFYNGGTRKPQWRVGYIELNPDGLSVATRAEKFLIGPGPVAGDATDIAFAASAVIVNDMVHLYYTVSDSTLMRATLKLDP